jgi:hypothetical protein
MSKEHKIKCQILITSTDIISIRGTEKIDAILQWKFEEDVRGVSLTVLDQKYEDYFNLIYPSLIKNSNKDSIRIFPTEKFEGCEILELILEGAHGYDFSNGPLWEHYTYTIRYKKMTIKLDRKNNENANAILYLSKSCLSFFNEELFDINLDPLHRNSFEVLSRYADESIKYDNLSIVPKYELYSKPSNEINEHNLVKIPSLHVNSISPDWEEKAFDYCQIACNFLSLHSQRYIYPWYWRIESANFDLIVFDLHHHVNSMIYPKYSGIGIRKHTTCEYVNTANLERCLKHRNILSDITEARIRAHHSNGQIRFMFLFVIIEKIKDLYAKEDKSKSEDKRYEYKFSKEESEVETVIENAINSVFEIIHDSDKEAYQERFDELKTVFKFQTMKKQFENLFARHNIDTEINYGFNFKKATNIRNKIFHGSPLKAQEENYMNDIILASKMSKLAGDLIWKVKK